MSSKEGSLWHGAGQRGMSGGGGVTSTLAVTVTPPVLHRMAGRGCQEGGWGQRPGSSPAQSGCGWERGRGQPASVQSVVPGGGVTCSLDGGGDTCGERFAGLQYCGPSSSCSGYPSGPCLILQSLKRKEKEYEHEMERLAREKIATQQRLAELKHELSQWMDVLEIDRVLRQTGQPEDDQASTSTASGEPYMPLPGRALVPQPHVPRPQGHLLLLQPLVSQVLLTHPCPHVSPQRVRTT